MSLFDNFDLKQQNSIVLESNKKPFNSLMSNENKNKPDIKIVRELIEERDEALETSQSED